jgi:hypothetical protein
MGEIVLMSMQVLLVLMALGPELTGAEDWEEWL